MAFAERSAFNFGQLSVLRVSSGASQPRRKDEAPATPDRLELDFAGWSHGGRWALQLDTALGRPGDPTLVVAQGLACLAVAWWAQLSPKSYLERVGGALFISPLNFSPSEASAARSLRPSPGTKLPFPSIVTSHASPIIEQVLDLADIWGSQFVDADASPDTARRALEGHPLAQQHRLMALIDASWADSAPTDLVEPAYLTDRAPFAV
jgi:predicted alpha/beta hydrolase family esterase